MHRSILLSLVIVSGLAIAATPPTSEPSEQACCASGSPGITSKLTLGLEGANRVLAAAIAEAQRRNAGGAIAIVDDGGSLLAFQRLDGTFAAGASVSIGKARTAATFRKASGAFEQAIKDGRTALVGVQELTPLQGGIPIVYDGQVVGAIGVSGAHNQTEDEEIAVAGAAAVTGATAAQQ